MYSILLYINYRYSKKVYQRHYLIPPHTPLQLFLELRIIISLTVPEHMHKALEKAIKANNRPKNRSEVLATGKRSTAQ